MNEWQYNRLRSIPDDPKGRRSDVQIAPIDRDMLAEGWVESCDVPDISAPPWRPGTVKALRRTLAGAGAMEAAENQWKAARQHDPDHGPAEFVAVETGDGLCVVRVPKGCPEIAEEVCREAFGSMAAIRIVARKSDHDNAFLDALNPDGHPYWRASTGRAMLDRGSELRISMGLPPFPEKT